MTDSAPVSREVTSPVPLKRVGRSPIAAFTVSLFKEKPVGAAGAVVALVFVFTAAFSELVAPYGMNEISGSLLMEPSAEFLFGTDNLGRDILSRVIYGSRISVTVGLAGSIIATVLATLIGIVSGYVGGKFDLLVQRVVDAWMSLPGLVLLMVIMAMIGPSLWSVIGVLGVSWGINGSRIIRSAVIGIKENMYVTAARAIGCPPWQVLVRHLLPNIMPTIIIIFTTNVPGIILAEASLSFLGFGVPPPAPSWGGMLGGKGYDYMFMAPWMAIWPGLALALLVVGVNMFGDAVRDILDPRMRGGVGRYGIKINKEQLTRELTKQSDR